MSDAIGMIGLGNAGSALAAALSGKLPLVGYDRDPNRRQAVSGLAIECVDSVAEVVARAKRIILSLPAPDISQAVVTELLAGEQVPDLIIETSTVTPEVAQTLDRLCRARRVGFVDAAIASGVAAMATGQVTFLGWRRGSGRGAGPAGARAHGEADHALGAGRRRHGRQGGEQRRHARRHGGVD